MIEVSVYKQSDYPISEKLIKTKLQEILKKKGVESGNVSVAIVSEKKMEELVKKYYKGDPEHKYIHPILTFPYNDEYSIGEIIIPANQARDQKNLLMLLEHGALHLLGKHHH
jgi:ssRNA-specific RNase YbeY (16S rRNA maturation enzyme)